MYLLMEYFGQGTCQAQFQMQKWEFPRNFYPEDRVEKRELKSLITLIQIRLGWDLLEYKLKSSGAAKILMAQGIGKKINSLYEFG